MGHFDCRFNFVAGKLSFFILKEKILKYVYIYGEIVGYFLQDTQLNSIISVVYRLDMIECELPYFAREFVLGKKTLILRLHHFRTTDQERRLSSVML